VGKLMIVHKGFSVSTAIKALKEDPIERLSNSDTDDHVVNDLQGVFGRCEMRPISHCLNLVS